MAAITHLDRLQELLQPSGLLHGDAKHATRQIVVQIYNLLHKAPPLIAGGNAVDFDAAFRDTDVIRQANALSSTNRDIRHSAQANLQSQGNWMLALQEKLERRGLLKANEAEHDYDVTDNIYGHNTQAAVKKLYHGKPPVSLREVHADLQQHTGPFAALDKDHPAHEVAARPAVKPAPAAHAEKPPVAAVITATKGVAPESQPTQAAKGVEDMTGFRVETLIEPLTPITQVQTNKITMPGTKKSDAPSGQSAAQEAPLVEPYAEPLSAKKPATLEPQPELLNIPSEPAPTPSVAAKASPVANPRDMSIANVVQVKGSGDVAAADIKVPTRSDLETATAPAAATEVPKAESKSPESSTKAPPLDPVSFAKKWLEKKAAPFSKLAGLFKKHGPEQTEHRDGVVPVALGAATPEALKVHLPGEPATAAPAANTPKLQPAVRGFGKDAPPLPAFEDAYQAFNPKPGEAAKHETNKQKFERLTQGGNPGHVELAYGPLAQEYYRQTGTLPEKRGLIGGGIQALTLAPAIATAALINLVGDAVTPSNALLKDEAGNALHEPVSGSVVHEHEGLGRKKARNVGADIRHFFSSIGQAVSDSDHDNKIGLGEIKENQKAWHESDARKAMKADVQEAREEKHLEKNKAKKNADLNHEDLVYLDHARNVTKDIAQNTKVHGSTTFNPSDAHHRTGKTANKEVLDLG